MTFSFLGIILGGQSKKEGDEPVSTVDRRFEERALKLTEQLVRGRESIVCIDSHTGGEPTRLVIGGFPEIKGSNIGEKSQFFERNYDHLRTVLTAEPRGRKAMHALVLCPPSTAEGDFGLIIMCALGYLGMCGHGLIGAVATAIEVGIIEGVEPVTRVVVETPSGEMRVRANVIDGKVENVTFRNQPSFVFKQDLEIEIETYGRLNVDVAYGGNWFAVVDAEQLGVELSNANLDKLGRANNLILNAVNSQISVNHPILGPGAGETIDQMVFMGPPRNPIADSMNLTTSDALGFDRSPCGTGSSAKMAVLHAKGRLGLNEDYVHESATTGSLFRGRLVKETQVGSIDAVIPEITGSAYLAGVYHTLVDPRDSLKDGFLVS
ncbi:MAG: proline racemase family protein [Candidatus Bipolaricaulota bacterium]